MNKEATIKINRSDYASILTRLLELEMIMNKEFNEPNEDNINYLKTKIKKLK